MSTSNDTTSAWWYVWIIAKDDSFLNGVISKLVRRGFTVGPLGRCLVTKNDDSPSMVLALSMHREPKTEQEKQDNNAAGIRGEDVEAIKVAKGRYLAMVVSKNDRCTWSLGNASVADEQRELTADRQKLN